MLGALFGGLEGLVLRIPPFPGACTETRPRVVRRKRPGPSEAIVLWGA